MDRSGPLVSVVMANRNGAAYIGLAISAVLAQTLSDLELIVVDDASEDNSWEIIQGFAAQDKRVRTLRRTSVGGPAAARNDALAIATGEWVAICDSDDSQHPSRLQLMLASALKLQADFVADDLILFSDRPMLRGETILGQHAPAEPRRLGVNDIVLSGVERSGLRHVGYLKPLIRRDALQELEYDSALRVGEDYDLYLRLVLSGAKMWVLPMAAYLYRRHAGSVSYRNVPADLTAQMDALRRIAQDINAPQIDTALRRRLRSLKRRHAQLVLAREVRAGRWLRAVWLTLGRPDHLVWFGAVVRNRAGLRLQAIVSRFLRRPVVWHLGEGAGALPVPRRSDGSLDLSHSAAGFWSKLAAAASRRVVRLRISGAIGQSAAWMVPAAQATVTGSTAQDALPIVADPALAASEAKGTSPSSKGAAQ